MMILITTVYLSADEILDAVQDADSPYPEQFNLKDRQRSENKTLTNPEAGVCERQNGQDWI